MLADDLLALAVDTAMEASALIRSATVRDIDTKSTSTDMVTEVDRASEALIVGKLLGARPDDGVLGEEGSVDTGTSGVRWVIDPIDGTTNFIYGFPAYAVSIAAEIDGETEIGVVHDVARGETFTAVKGAGAFCDGKPLRVGGPLSLGEALIGTGFAYAPETRTRQARILAGLLGRIRDVRRAGSAALDLCWVGAGRPDGYYEAGIKLWDRAAGALIAAEAGAWVGDLDDITIAIVPQLAEEFLRELTAAIAAGA